MSYSNGNQSTGEPIQFEFEIEAAYYDLDDIPSEAGVYIIMGKFTGTMVYGGQSMDIKHRIDQHLGKNSDKPAMRSAMMAVDSSRFTVAVFNLADCERASGIVGNPALRCIESIMVYGLKPHFNVRRFSKHGGKNSVAIARRDHLSLSVGVCLGLSAVSHWHVDAISAMV